jgi:hypothetical protein
MHPSWDVPSDKCPTLRGKYPNGPVFLYDISYKQPVVSGKVLLLNADVLGGTGLSNFVHANKVFLFNVKAPETIGFEFNEDNLATPTQIASWVVTHVKKHKSGTLQVVCTIGEISIAWFIDPTSAEKSDITLPVPRDNVVCSRKQNSMPNGEDVLDWLLQQVRPVDLSTISEDTLSKMNDLFRQIGVREISNRSSIASASGGAAKKASTSTRTTLSYANATVQSEIDVASIPSKIEDLYREIQDLEKEMAIRAAQEKALKEQENKKIINAIKNADSDLLSALVEQLDPEQISSLESLIAIQLEIHSANAALAAEAEATRRQAQANLRQSEAASLPSLILSGITIPRGDVISGANAEDYLASKKKKDEEKLAARNEKKKAFAAAKKAADKSAEAATKVAKEDREKRKAAFEASVAASQTSSTDNINPFQALSNGGDSASSSRVSSPSSFIWAEQEADDEKEE